MTYPYCDCNQSYMGYLNNCCNTQSMIDAANMYRVNIIPLLTYNPLHTFQVMNISVDPQYQAKLQEKSTAAIEIELAEQKAAQLEKQLEQEQAQTEIDLEKARRANLVAEEEAKVYETSKEAYELKRLELMKDRLGESDKVYFIPEGADITLFLGTDKPVVNP